MSLSHRKLSAWYLQLAQQLEAGLPMAEALRSSRGTGAPPAGLEAMAATIEGGGSVDDALQGAATWLPLADTLALSAAAEAGRVPRTLRNLATRHEHIGAATLKIVLACAYPVAVLHLAMLLFPVVRMIDWEKGFLWNAAAYARGVAVGLGPLWALGVVIVILARRRSLVLRRFAELLPALGTYLRQQALADFSFALGNFLEAGVPIAQAWAAAGLISHSPELKAAATAMEAAIARGEAPGPKLAAWRCFPADFAALYRSGEATGQLEGNLHRLTAQNQEAANRALSFATMLYPAILFGGIALTVGYFVVKVFSGYVKMLGKLAE